MSKPSEIRSPHSITVIVTHHNRVEMCLRCLQSIDDQTHKPNHVIVVDDASTQPTAQIRDYCKDKDWLFLQNDTNQFVGYCRELALRYVTTTHVVYIDDDDWFYSEAIEIFHSALAQEPNEPHSFLLDVMHHNGSLHPQTRRHEGRSKDISQFLESLVSIHATVVPTKQLIASQFNVLLRYYVDIYVWLQIHVKVGFWNYHDQIVGVYNRSGQPSITKVSSKNYKAQIKTFRSFVNTFTTDQVLIWSHERLVGAYFCLGSEAYDGWDSIVEFCRSGLFLFRKGKFQKSNYVIRTIPKLLFQHAFEKSRGLRSLR